MLADATAEYARSTEYSLDSPDLDPSEYYVLNVLKQLVHEKTERIVSVPIVTATNVASRIE